MKITSKNIDFLLKGASLLSCGGGLAYEQQTEDIKKIIKALPLEIIPIQKLDDEDVLITVSEVGPSNAPPISKQDLTRLVAILKDKYGLDPPTALLPLEIGQESITLEAAAILNLPVVDSDMSGQRAVPKIGLDLISLNGMRSKGPLLAVNSGADIMSMDQQTNIKEVEERLREFAAKSDGVVLVISDYQKVKDVKNLLKHRSYSFALDVGKNKTLESSSRLLEKRSVTVTSIKVNHKSGFYSATITATDQSGNSIILKVLNEFVSCKDEISGKTYEFPDLITLIDQKNGHGVGSSNLKINQHYELVVIAAIKPWQKLVKELPLI